MDISNVARTADITAAIGQTAVNVQTAVKPAKQGSSKDIWRRTHMERRGSKDVLSTIREERSEAFEIASWAVALNKTERCSKGWECISVVIKATAFIVGRSTLLQPYTGECWSVLEKSTWQEVVLTVYLKSDDLQKYLSTTMLELLQKEIQIRKTWASHLELQLAGFFLNPYILVQVWYLQQFEYPPPDECQQLNWPKRDCRPPTVPSWDKHTRR